MAKAYYFNYIPVSDTSQFPTDEAVYICDKMTHLKNMNFRLKIKIIFLASKIKSYYLMRKVPAVYIRISYVDLGIIVHGIIVRINREKYLLLLRKTMRFLYHLEQIELQKKVQMKKSYQR